MPINTPTGYLDITNATLRGSKIVTTGFVGIANANPTNHLSIGSNLHINDTHSNVLQISGNINAASVVLGGISIAPTFDLEIITNTGNTTPYTVEFNNTATAFVTTANATIGDTLTASKLVGDGSGISAIQSSNVTDFASNVSRITALESSRALGSDLDSNSARITNLSSNLSDNSSRITTLESGDISISGDKTFTGDIIFESNVHMNSGNVFVANTVNLTVTDPIIELGSNNSGTNDLGIIMTRPNNNSNVSIVFDESDDILRMGYTLNGANDTVVSLDSNALAVSVQGALSAASVSGDGSGLTSLNASNITTGALSTTTVTIDDYLIHSGDTDTKVGFPSTDTFTVTTANSERLRVDSSGNVGISTTSPTSKLELAGDNGGSMITLKRTNASNGGAKGGIRFTENTNGYNVGTIACLGDGANTSGALCFYTKASSTETGPYLATTDERMRISSGGNVGIGTASPACKLDIASEDVMIRGNTPSLNFSEGTNGMDGAFRIRYDGANEQNNDNFLAVQTGNNFGVTPLHMTYDGKVGIGTTNPIRVLDSRSGNGSSSAGWISGAFGPATGLSTNPRVVVGTYSNVAIVGSHRGDLGAWTDLYLNNPGYPVVVKTNGSVGIGTTNPGRAFEVYTGNGNTPGLRLRRYPTGAAYTDLRHADSPDGLAIHTSDGNATTLEVMRICGFNGGRVGIKTTSPSCALDVGGSINNGTYAVSNGYMANKSLTIGDHSQNYGGGTGGWHSSTAGLMMECLDTTEIGIHDSGTRVASFMYFEGGSTNRFTIGRSMGWGAISSIALYGNVGIGTNAPLAALDVPTSVSGTISVNNNQGGYWFSWNTAGTKFYSNQTVTVAGNFDGGSVTAHTFYAGYSIQFLSDRRIKKDIREIDDESALEKFRLLKPSKYKYIEPLLSGRTDKEVYGFIAQEVAEVLPEGVTIGGSVKDGTNQGHIPNIMSMCSIESQSISSDAYEILNTEQKGEYIETGNTYTRHVVTITKTIDPSTFNVDSSTRSYKFVEQTKTTGAFDKNSDGKYHPLVFYGNDLKTICADVVRVIDDSSFVVDKKLDLNQYEDGELLLYGQKPDDFYRLNKDSIFTLASAALQEVDRQQQADKVRIAELETQVASLLERVTALENA